MTLNNRSRSSRSRRRSSGSGNTELIAAVGGLGIFMTIVMAIVTAFTFWTDRNLDFWISHFKGEEVDVPFWLSFVVTIVGNGIIFFANVVAEIARFAI